MLERMVRGNCDFPGCRKRRTVKVDQDPLRGGGPHQARAILADRWGWSYVNDQDLCEIHTES